MRQPSLLQPHLGDNLLTYDKILKLGLLSNEIPADATPPQIENVVNIYLKEWRPEERMRAVELIYHNRRQILQASQNSINEEDIFEGIEATSRHTEAQKPASLETRAISEDERRAVESDTIAAPAFTFEDPTTSIHPAFEKIPDPSNE